MSTRHVWYEYNIAYSSVLSETCLSVTGNITSWTACKECPTINTSTGKFVTNGDTESVTNQGNRINAETYPYMVSYDEKTYLYATTDVNMHGERTWRKYTSSQTGLWYDYVDDNIFTDGFESFDIYTLSTAKGSTKQGTVSNASSSKYPTDGTA